MLLLFSDVFSAILYAHLYPEFNFCHYACTAINGAGACTKNPTLSTPTFSAQKFDRITSLPSDEEPVTYTFYSFLVKEVSGLYKESGKAFVRYSLYVAYGLLPKKQRCYFAFCFFKV